ncbi:MAG: trigger factor, partial [Acidaminococcaceae bacterium]
FKVNVQDVKRKEMPELTDEFVAANSDCKTVAELRKSHQEKMQAAAEAQVVADYERALIAQAIANAKFEVPEIMVEDRVSQMVEELKMNLESRNMTLDMYMKYSGLDMDKIRANHKETALENVKTDLVLDAIAKAENVQVGMEDVDAELEAIAAQHGAKLDEVKKIIAGNGNMGLLLANILRRKAAKVIIDGAAK